jgi:hypothetical protein
MIAGAKSSDGVLTPFFKSFEGLVIFTLFESSCACRVIIDNPPRQKANASMSVFMLV